MRRAKKTWTAEPGTSLRNDTLMPPMETWTSPDCLVCFQSKRTFKDDRVSFK